MKRTILFVMTLLCFLQSRSQNLVPNPGFETAAPCPNNSGQWNRCPGWDNVNMVTGVGSNGSPDFFHTCGTSIGSIPNTAYGSNTAHLNSNGMMGLVMWNVGYANYREYIATNLACAMQPGTTYTVSFWIKNGSADQRSIRNIGIHFSVGNLLQTGASIINVVPQVEITTNVNATTWQQYSFVIMASAPWNKITIGNFRTDSQNNPIIIGNGGLYGCYVFDDIEVKTPGGFNVVQSTVQPGCGQSTGSAAVYPSNPAYNYSYIWTPGGNTTNSASNLAPGTYVVATMANVGCVKQTVTTTVVIKSPPTPVIVSAPNVTACANSASVTQLNATTNQGTSGMTFNWMPGNLSGPSVSVPLNGPTAYVVTVTSPQGCTGSANLAITTITNCCPQPTANLIPLTQGNIVANSNYANASYLVSQNITLPGNITFQNAEVLFTPGVQLDVPAGMTLNLDHAHLYACGLNMWNGINVQDQGQIVSSFNKGSSLIEDAITGVNLANVTTLHANPPISLKNIIFNRNYVGINIQNVSTAITSLPIDLTGAVFCSRILNFTNVTWPSSNVSPTGLRWAAPGATLGVAPPYLLQSYPQANLKLPYTSQPGQAGIKITNVANVQGAAPVDGVDIGVTYPGGNNGFNLFDGLGRGIEIEDASLRTMNNVFQSSISFSVNNSNQPGRGIAHKVNSLMNARLDLRPVGPSNQTTDFGNRFWNCVAGINAKNVYDVNIEYALFRSDRIVTSGFTAGFMGAMLESNRIKYNINLCEFNNVENGLWINASGGNYDVGSGVAAGTWFGNSSISQNYFGPEVSSTTPVAPGTQLIGNAITLQGLNSSNWISAGRLMITSNKIDRAFRGISVKSLQDLYTEIGGNNILLSDDNFLQPNLQYGIYAERSTGNLSIIQNIVSGQGPIKLNVFCVKSVDNVGSNSPIISCNQVSSADVGFEFSGVQANTTWFGNSMTQPMNSGLSLVNFAEIGVQGSIAQTCADRWYDAGPSLWASNCQTYTDGSINTCGNLSFLWCENPPIAFPVTNCMVSASGFGACSLGMVGPAGGADCLYQNNYPTLPSQRSAPLNANGLTAFQESKLPWFNNLMPNPAIDKISFDVLDKNAVLTVKIIDITGRVVLNKTVLATESLDISTLPSAVYTVKITNEQSKEVSKKLVKL